MDITWENTLKIKNWVGHQQIAYNYAVELGYPYYIWNERVYEANSDCPKDTGMLEREIGSNKTACDLPLIVGNRTMESCKDCPSMKWLGESPSFGDAGCSCSFGVVNYDTDADKPIPDSCPLWAINQDK